MTEKSKAKRTARNLLIDFATLFVIAVVAIVIFAVIGQGSGSSTSGDSTITAINLYCSKPGNRNQFLSTAYRPTSGLHEIRANFREDYLSDIMYTFTATFEPGTKLEEVKNSLQADFNLAYGNTYVYRDGVWSASFSVFEEENKIRMTVTTESAYLKSKNAEVFQLLPDETPPKTLNGMKSLYESAAYSCQISE